MDDAKTWIAGVFDRAAPSYDQAAGRYHEYFGEQLADDRLDRLRREVGARIESMSGTGPHPLRLPALLARTSSPLTT